MINFINRSTQREWHMNMKTDNGGSVFVRQEMPNIIGKIVEARRETWNSFSPNAFRMSIFLTIP